MDIIWPERGRTFQRVARRIKAYLLVKMVLSPEASKRSRQVVMVVEILLTTLSACRKAKVAQLAVRHSTGAVSLSRNTR